MLRHSLADLINWKNSLGRKPLIVEGSRQVGKTWLVREFANEFFESTAYVNCEGNERMKLLFAGEPDFVRLIAALQIETGTSISKENTIIILDNINSVGTASEIMKSFVNCPYYVIGVSSLTESRDSGFDYLSVYPMSFMEFLEARGFKDLAELLGTRDWELKKVFASKYIELLRDYLFVGGMPECVSSFLNTEDYSKVRRVQKRILTEYDLSFFGQSFGKKVGKIQAVYKCVPDQIIRENNKFIYDKVRSGARAKEYTDALLCLLSTGLVGRVNRITTPNKALMEYSSNTFKLYMNDVGLLGVRLGIDYKEYGKNDIFDEYYCAISQQFVWQEMRTKGIEPRYWSAYKGTSKVDFVLMCDGEIMPVETIGEENPKGKNLRVYMEKFKPKRAFRLSLSDYKNVDGIVNVPIYAAGYIMDVCSGDILVR